MNTHAHVKFNATVLASSTIRSDYLQHYANKWVNFTENNLMRVLRGIQN